MHVSSCLVNLFKSQKASEKIVLIIGCPVPGKAKAFAQTEHRLEVGDCSPCRFEGLEAAGLLPVIRGADKNSHCSCSDPKVVTSKKRPQTLAITI